MKETQPKAREELLKELQEELDRRTEIESRAIQLIAEGKDKEAAELINTLDDTIIATLLTQLDKIT